MSEQIPQDQERQEHGGVEGAMEDLELSEQDAGAIRGGALPPPPTDTGGGDSDMHQRGKGR